MGILRSYSNSEFHSPEHNKRCAHFGIPLPQSRNSTPPAFGIPLPNVNFNNYLIRNMVSFRNSTPLNDLSTMNNSEFHSLSSFLMVITESMSEFHSPKKDNVLGIPLWFFRNSTPPTFGIPLPYKYA